ncbi:hypothetical protein [Modestobacter lapidis]|nr:hypothetical protein [Modestobacter lapidis]
MLILTPTPLETAAERAFFAELAGWDTGGSVRGGVMASLPAVDGPMQRRQADAVLFVPEGIAVVRVVEVSRQSGVVTAIEEGSWTIGPDAGPGDVLRLAGGGSTPLEGLMRAGMDAAVRLRKAGLEPGRIARLTVLTGDVTGLVPADGDLGDGDQVALLDPRSLLLGIARASRYAGKDNPRLWTTADVRSGIEALGVTGRSPAVEELNVEGFPYSPYVLRRRELLVPMSLPSARGAAMPWSSDGAAAPTATAAPRRAVADGPLVDPAAAARLAAAAVHAQEAAEVAEAARAAADRPAQERTAQPAADADQVGADQAGADQAGADQAAVPTVAVSSPGSGPSADAPAGADRDDAAERTAVAGSLPAAAQASAGSTVALPATTPSGSSATRSPAAAPSASRDTMALPTGPGPETVDVRPGRPDRVAGPGTAPDDTGGLRGLFGGPDTGAAAHPAGLPGPGGAPRRPLALLVTAALLVAVLLGVGGFLLLRDPDGGDAGTTPAAATTGNPATPTTPAAPAPGDTEVLEGFRFTLQTGRVDDSCAGRAYGAVADYFTRSDCVGLSRALWTAETEGGWAVVSLSRVVMPNAASAQALQDLADTDGSGNVSDLLREGVRVDGAPERLSGAEYGSAVDGATVTIVETDWADPAVRGGSATLDTLADAALALPAAAVPRAPVD